MNKILPVIIKSLFSLLVIAAILGAGAVIRAEWIRLSEDKRALVVKQDMLEQAKARADQLELEVSRKIPEWKKAREAKVRQAMKELALFDEQIRRKGADLTRRIKNLSDAEKNLHKLALDFNEKNARAKKLKPSRWAENTPFLEKSRKQIGAHKFAHGRAVLAYEKYKAFKVIYNKLNQPTGGSAIKALQDERRRKEAEMQKAKSFRSTDELRLNEEKARAKAETDGLKGLIKREAARVANDPWERYLSAVREQFPTALAILLGIILTPILIKTVLYYGVAPLAARFRPIRLKYGGSPSLPVSGVSAVSIPLYIEDGNVILIHGDYLQSSDRTAPTRTQYFLNRKFPLSSIASGMYLLTAIRPPIGTSTRVVVSPQNDKFGELGMVKLPAGSAMVIQPRSLAGVVKRSDVELQITRQWRLTSLHAWITLQLRFLIIHGPCDLILKGCKGVCVEEPHPERPRWINQCATIGFSVNLEYQNTRCETFTSYLTGKNNLFNDLFGGSPGIFVYEQIPAGGQKGGITGRTLEGFVDAGLKVFGI